MKSTEKNGKKHAQNHQKSSSAEEIDDILIDLERLCQCDRILSNDDISEFGDISKFYDVVDDRTTDVDQCSLDFEVEHLKLKHLLDIPDDTHSLTKIETNLPRCLKYGFRSGSTHMNMQQFPKLSRGLQGPAIAVAAITTAYLMEPDCWNEPIIDRIVEDGDEYFCDSYKKIHIDDRRFVTLRDLKRELIVRTNHQFTIRIDDPIYAGTFRSETPKNLHIAKALDLFFRRSNSCILTSPVLNIAIWKSSKYFYIFDGQARLENCEIADSDKEGSAKLMILQNLIGVLFIILEKSRVENESFVLYNITIVDMRKISSDFNEKDKLLIEPKRRPSGYMVQEKYRAVIRGSYHLHHPILPQEFQGKGHLVIAVSAIVYSKLLSSRKWTRVMLDLIFNQANIYLTDLVRILGKKLDDSFEMTIDDLLCDVVFGVYTAKIKVQQNVIPGEGKKGKATMDTGLREFFAAHSSGIIELKKTFYAIWKEGDKFYLLDPFSCDSEGFRLNPSDPEQAERYKTAASCVTMNSSIDQLIETLLENTESKDKDPFIIHGLSILYIKAGTSKDGSDEKVIFREKRINRRPERPPSPPSTILDECETAIDTLPRVKIEDENVDNITQYPEHMDRIDLFVGSSDRESLAEYKIINPRRLILYGARNCRSVKYERSIRGKQGLTIALTTFARSVMSDISEWDRTDIDKIIDEGSIIYERLKSWILHGSPENEFDVEIEDEELFANKELETFSRKSKHTFAATLEQVDVSMLPKKMKINDKSVQLAWKLNVSEGEANPLVNLGEALERYFDEFNYMIFENKKLMYGLWKMEDKYFILNPYGCDKEGWRLNVGPAALTVVDSVNELVNFMYGLLEFNDHHFIFHYIEIKVEEDDENDEDNSSINVPEIQSFEKYKTKFLPITDEQLVDLTHTSNEEEIEVMDTVSVYGNRLSVKSIKSGETMRTTTLSKTMTVTSSKLSSMNLFTEANEPEQSDAPARLNLALVTGIVKMKNLDETVDCEENIKIFYEKLKYKHPPPFVIPPKKNLCQLLGIKQASKSICSLLSRFSIDSRLPMKEKDNSDVVINILNENEKSKLITIPSKKYFFSMSLPSKLTPIRAVDDQFIRDKNLEKDQENDCRRKKIEEQIIMIPEDSTDPSPNQILPVIIPLGPCIMTPLPKLKINDCPDKKKKKCPLSEKEQEDAILKRLVCSSENLLIELILPNFGKHEVAIKCNNNDGTSVIIEEKSEDESNEDAQKHPEPCGFQSTEDDEIGIIHANTSLEDRLTVEESHYKSCYFSAILCILAKINISVHAFRPSFLDRFILAANKISGGTGKLRYKITRWFRNFNILGAKYNVILKQVRYADPENYEPDDLRIVLKYFLDKHQTGVLTFGNASYAFWTANDIFYLFDPYSCDEMGKANAEGAACLLEICNFEKFVEKILENNGEMSSKPYRLYTLAIAHLERNRKITKKKRKKVKPCKDSESEEECHTTEEEDPNELQPKSSLIELVEWVDKTKIAPPDPSITGYQPIKNYEASALEVAVLENEITRPILAPFKDEASKVPERQTVFDRKFYNDTVLAESLDLCIMAWSQIHDPHIWSVRTIQALHQASLEYNFDSLLAAEDSTMPSMTDDLLTEFNIGNYNFRVVFAPLHSGILYAEVGWNLAMSLEKIFQSTVYTGAILVCEGTQIGVMKKDDRFYAWWLINMTKSVRFIVTENIEDYLKLLVKEINQSGEVEFTMRIITISYAKMFGPNCSDIEGLHEPVKPSASLAEIHQKQIDDYDIEAIFKQIDHSCMPMFIFGTVALSERDTVIEPRVKRCYFVALIALAMKRDVIQNTLPGMVDKILELAETIYKLFEDPKYHTEHILKDVTLMNRMFDIRDCASDLVSLQDEHQNIDKKMFPIAVRKHLKQFFKHCTGGIIHFSNCCYGFWYSETTKSYYYLDPYKCDAKGKRACSKGKACLFIFSSVCNMVRQMCINQFENTTGFFIHRVHIESVNALPCTKFHEDSFWNYLDYHWSYRHVHKQKDTKNKKSKEIDLQGENKNLLWKNYLIEVPNLIYSIWGTIGTFDSRFGYRAGKNQAAIAIAVFAVQNLCHPSEWNTTVLDSAVICGDSYYKESKKVSTCCLNSFNLSACLKVSPFIWNIEFRTEICGMLYGSTDQPNLADSIEYAFTRSTNVLLQCGKKILAILKTNDAFYAVDSSWSGTPLFTSNHGAIYAIRCKNRNALVYVVTKMLNTNYKIDITLTPVKIIFKQETCQSSDSKPKINRKKILDKPARSIPGPTLDHPNLVKGSDSVSDEDSYLIYSKQLKLGLARGIELEEIPELSYGKSKDSTSALPKKMKKLSTLKSKSANKALPSDKLICSILRRNIVHPRIINFLNDFNESCKTQINTKNVCKCLKPVIKAETFPIEKSICQNQLDIRSSFIVEEAREMFEKYNSELKKESHKNYKHTTKEDILSKAASVKAQASSINIAVENVDEIEKVQGGELNNQSETFRSSLHIDISK